MFYAERWSTKDYNRLYIMRRPAAVGADWQPAQ